MNTYRTPCCIFGAGELGKQELKLPENAYIIAADGGLRHLQAMGFTPDLTVGDFDSGEAPRTGQVVRLNPIKDETDTLWAVRYALKQGYRRFHLYGCTGGRSDHTFANLRLLHMLANEGAIGFLHSAHDVTFAIRNATVTFHPESKGYLSVFSLTDVSRGVSESGLKYSLDRYLMQATDTVGTSNEFTGQPAAVSVTDGVLLIILEDDAYIKEIH